MGGTELSVRPHQLLHQSPDDARLVGDPVSIEEKATLIGEWKRVLLLRTSRFFEGELLDVELYSETGKALLVLRGIAGEVHLLRRTGRMLLLGRSAHRSVEESLFFTADGVLIRAILHSSNLFENGQSSDERVFWTQERMVREGEPATLLRVYEWKGGREVYSRLMFKAGAVNFEYDGAEYEIRIGQIDLPG